MSSTKLYLFLNIRSSLINLFCCGTWTRTKITSSRGMCPTIRRSPNILLSLYSNTIVQKCLFIKFWYNNLMDKKFGVSSRGIIVCNEKLLVVKHDKDFDYY